MRDPAFPCLFVIVSASFQLRLGGAEQLLDGCSLSFSIGVALNMFGSFTFGAILFLSLLFFGG